MAQTKDLTKHDFEKALLLKIRENNLLKAQNSRLIEHLQDQIDVTSSNILQKESIHKKIANISTALNELSRQEQDRKINVDRIFQKISDLETRFVMIQKQENAPTQEEVQQLKMEFLKIESREKQLETHLQQLNVQLTNTNQALSVLLTKILKPHEKIDFKLFTGSKETPNKETLNTETIPFTEEDFKKIADEFKTELNKNDEDVQLIYRLVKNQDEST
jgi:hypothetical protein